MKQHRIYFNIVEKGYVSFATASEAQRAYERLQHKYELVEELGGEVTYEDTEFNYNKPTIKEVQ